MTVEIREARLTRQRDTTTLEGVYRRAGRGLYLQALAVTADPAAAEDLVQEAFARLLAKPGQLDAIDDLEGYLHRTVRNLALNRIRRAKTDSKARGKIEQRTVLVARDDTPSEREEAERVSRALADLPPDQREVVVLRIYDGLTFPQIAERTEAALGTVHSRFRYGMTKLRGLLEERS